MLRGIGRGDWIRTSDFHLPKMALYQAELRPEGQVDVSVNSLKVVYMYDADQATSFYRASRWAVSKRGLRKT